MVLISDDVSQHILHTLRGMLNRLVNTSHFVVGFGFIKFKSSPGMNGCHVSRLKVKYPLLRGQDLNQKSSICPFLQRIKIIYQFENMKILLPLYCEVIQCICLSETDCCTDTRATLRIWVKTLKGTSQETHCKSCIIKS